MKKALIFATVLMASACTDPEPCPDYHTGTEMPDCESWASAWAGSYNSAGTCAGSAMQYGSATCTAEDERTIILDDVRFVLSSPTQGTAPSGQLITDNMGNIATLQAGTVTMSGNVAAFTLTFSGGGQVFTCSGSYMQL
jgi:hypothetical protein